jgi:hypothetical protein
MNRRAFLGLLVPAAALGTVGVVATQPKPKRPTVYHTDWCARCLRRHPVLPHVDPETGKWYGKVEDAIPVIARDIHGRVAIPGCEGFIPIEISTGK